MSNTMCGIESAPVTASVPMTNNAAVMQYANGIKRVANNDTIAIREMSKWLITATESFDVPQMHDDLAKIVVQHEKDVELVLKDLDNYIKTQKPIAPDFLQLLATIKKENVEKIMNVFTLGILTGICQPVSEINLADLADDPGLIVTMSLIANLHDAIGKRAANEADPDTIPASVANHLVATIKCQSRFFAEQTKNLDHARALTIDELGWNFRRLADYCDKLERVMKGDRGSDSYGCCHSKAQYQCHGKRDVSSSEGSSHDSQTAYGMANKDLNHLLWLLSGLVTTTIIHRHQDGMLLEAERKMSADTQGDLEKAKIKDIKNRLSSEEQIDLIADNLNSLLSYIEVCQSSFINKSQESKSASK